MLELSVAEAVYDARPGCWNVALAGLVLSWESAVTRSRLRGWLKARI
jgi:hypothetical protein